MRFVILIVLGSALTGCAQYYDFLRGPGGEAIARGQERPSQQGGGAARCVSEQTASGRIYTR